MVVRSAPVAQVALGIQHVVRTIRNFLVGTPNAKSYGLTQLYDLCISSLFQVVYPRPEELESAQVSLTELRQYELRLRRAERRLHHDFQ